MILPTQLSCDRAHLRGEAFAVGEYNEPHPVDGIYEISTIDTGTRRETVAFKISGVGPKQIEEPYGVKTITIRGVE